MLSGAVKTSIQSPAFFREESSGEFSFLASIRTFKGRQIAPGARDSVKTKGRSHYGSLFRIVAFSRGYWTLLKTEKTKRELGPNLARSRSLYFCIISGHLQYTEYHSFSSFLSLNPIYTLVKAMPFQKLYVYCLCRSYWLSVERPYILEHL